MRLGPQPRELIDRSSRVLFTFDRKAAGGYPGDTTEALIGGIPTFAEYDDTDSLLNPTRGVRARFEVAPYAGTLEQEFTRFLTLDNRASTYWDVLDNDIYVLAGRVRLGSTIAESLDDVPGNQRLYAGGGGSVRGYAQYTVGPVGALGDPTGGRSSGMRTRCFWAEEP